MPSFYNGVQMTWDEAEKFMNHCQELEKKIEFLKERNKDLRQKTWYSVYEENLKLTEQIEVLKKLGKNHHSQTLKYYNQINQLSRENKTLKDAIASVQTFTKQFT
jgi:uncharacterized coiled-coil DUF342 family protein